MLERGIFCQNFGGTWLVLRFFCFLVLPVKPRGPDSQFLSPLEIRAAVAQHEREREREREREAHALYDYTDLWQNFFLKWISSEACCAKRMLHAKKKIAPPPDQRLISARGYELQGGGDDAVRVSAHAPPGVPPAREGCLPGHYCQGHPAVGQDRERGKNIYIHVSIYIHQCNTPLPRAPAVGQDREQAAIYIV